MRLPPGYDRRLTAANGRVASEEYRGEIAADTYVSGSARQIGVPVAELLSAPGGKRDRQLLFGWGVELFEEQDGFGFVRSRRDGYVGYVALESLTEAREATHWVTAAASHLYPEADFKSPDLALLSLGAELTIIGEEGRFLKTHDGRYVPAQHVAPMSFRFDDPAAVAGLLIGSPYLWGGNSRSGLDCSALVQIAFQASGRACPGDSDMQEAFFSKTSLGRNTIRRNDLLFWKGHVALAVSDQEIIHANAGHMAVAYEQIDAAIERIEAQGDGPITSIGRPD